RNVDRRHPLPLLLAVGHTANDTSGVANDNRCVRHIVYDHGPGSNQRIATDDHARQYSSVGTDPSPLQHMWPAQTRLRLRAIGIAGIGEYNVWSNPDSRSE